LTHPAGVGFPAGFHLLISLWLPIPLPLGARSHTDNMDNSDNTDNIYNTDNTYNSYSSYSTYNTNKTTYITVLPPSDRLPGA
jgi:hypothetical protein